MFRVGRDSYFIIPLLAFVIAGCSASDFKPPVTAFFTATNKAAASFKDYQDTIDKAVLERSIAMALANTVAPRASECGPDSTRCRLVVRERKGGKESLLDADSIEVFARLMDGVVAYAANLDAIVAADSTSEINSAVAAARTNLVSLARSADNLNKKVPVLDFGLESTVAPFAGPVAEAVSFGLGRIAEAQKIEALRNSTASMEAIFPSITKLLSRVANDAMKRTRNQLYAIYRNTAIAFQAKPSKSNLDAYRKAADTYDAALQVDPAAIFVALQRAHTALAEALRNPQLNSETLWPLLQQVTDEATKLATIAQDLRKASENRAKS